MLDEDVPSAFLDGVSSVDQTQVRRLLSGLTKRQDRAKVAGFIPIDAPVSGSNGSSSGSSASIVSSPSTRELMSVGCVEERDRFFVVVPLSEAQALRRSVHTSNPLYRRSDDVQFALWALDGHLIETTPFYRPATMPDSTRASLDGGSGAATGSAPVLNNYQINLSLQTARFMNGELYYTDEEVRADSCSASDGENSSPTVHWHKQLTLTIALCLLFPSCFSFLPLQLVSLLRGVGDIHPAHRRTLVDQLLLSRHRDQRTTRRTPLERALRLDDEAHYFLLHSFIVAFRSRCDARGLSLLQAFHCFDLDGNGLIDADELWTACHALGMQPADGAADGSTAASASSGGGGCVRPADVMDVIHYADADGNGQLDFGEFAAAFRTREEAAAEDHHSQPVDGQDDKPTTPRTPSSAAAAADVAPADASEAMPKLTLMRMPAPELQPPPPAFVRPVVATAVAAPASRSAPAAPSMPSAAPWPSAFPGAAATARSPASGPGPAAAAPSPAVVTPAPAAPLPRSPPVVVAATEWSCAACTFTNRPGRSRCEICDTPKQ
jgi:hypothetical protein